MSVTYREISGSHRRLSAPIPRRLGLVPLTTRITYRWKPPAAG